MTASAPPWSTRRLSTVGFLCVLVLFGGFGGWAAFARIDGAVVASGKVEVAQNRQEVAHRDGGIVASLNVGEGDKVKAGDILLTLSANELRNDISIADGQYFELLARAARLEAERDGADALTFPDELRARVSVDHVATKAAETQRSLFEARRITQAREIEQLEKRKTQIDAQIDGLEAQAAALTEQKALAEADLEDQTSLRARGLTQQSRVTDLRREVIGLTGEISRLAASLAQARAQITEIDLAILKLGTDQRERAISELQDIEPALSRLREQRAAMSARAARLELKAPVSGTVYGLSVFGPEAVISPAEPVLYIVPADSPLIITAKISPTHVDQVYRGQPVRLRFTSFDQRRTPELLGTLLTISPDAFRDEFTGAQYYRAEFTLPQDQRARLPEGTTLLPGMPVEVFMSRGGRTPLAYLVKPLADYFNRAFRED
ncbi:HlyD family type I secretion periplasmic adaptor subunit [Celeribacter sp.]|uniref:HlyD family type I secretion periplasmic adaptor subunit n=1 Tax=Celeribacter sp. TaxID=1890673 RepID=UPI003A9289B2